MARNCLLLRTINGKDRKNKHFLNALCRIGCIFPVQRAKSTGLSTHPECQTEMRGVAWPSIKIGGFERMHVHRIVGKMKSVKNLPSCTPRISIFLEFTAVRRRHSIKTIRTISLWEESKIMKSEEFKISWISLVSPISITIARFTAWLTTNNQRKIRFGSTSELKISVK